MGDGAAKRGRQRNHRSDIIRPLACYRPRDQSSQAVADQVNFSFGFGQGSFDRLVQMTLDQQVRALGVDPDARKIRPIADAPQPTVELHQIKVCAEKPRNDDDSGSIAMRYPKAVIDRRCVQQENLGAEQRLGPK